MKFISVIGVGLVITFLYADDIINSSSTELNSTKTESIEDDPKDTASNMDNNNIKYIEYERMKEKIKYYEIIEGGEG